MSNSIKAGYRIAVTSWENDADNYRTIIKDGYTFEQMQVICELLSHMGSRSNVPKSAKQFGNMYEPRSGDVESLTEFWREFLAKHAVVAKALEFTPEDDIDDDDLFYQFGEIVGEFTGSGEFFTRVAESFTVEYVPQDITFEDVTDQFSQPLNYWG
jgi:hypothetical protein